MSPAWTQEFALLLLLLAGRRANEEEDTFLVGLRAPAEAYWVSRTSVGIAPRSAGVVEVPAPSVGGGTGHRAKQRAEKLAPLPGEMMRLVISRE